MRDIADQMELGIGAFPPLQGMYAAEEFDRAILGSALGVGAVPFAGGAMGPATAGWLTELTGSRLWAVVLAATATIQIRETTNPNT